MLGGVQFFELGVGFLSVSLHWRFTGDSLSSQMGHLP